MKEPRCKPNRHLLEFLHYECKLSLLLIGGLFGVSPRVVRRWFGGCDLETRHGGKGFKVNIHRVHVVLALDDLGWSKRSICRGLNMNVGVLTRILEENKESG